MHAPLCNEAVGVMPTSHTVFRFVFKGTNLENCFRGRLGDSLQVIIFDRRLIGEERIGMHVCGVECVSIVHDKECLKHSPCRRSMSVRRSIVVGCTNARN